MIKKITRKQNFEEMSWMDKSNNVRTNVIMALKGKILLEAYQ